jgi:hypothetical protein
MRLSLQKAAHAAVRWIRVQEIRVKPFFGLSGTRRSSSSYPSDFEPMCFSAAVKPCRQHIQRDASLNTVYRFCRSRSSRKPRFHARCSIPFYSQIQHATLTSWYFSRSNRTVARHDTYFPLFATNVPELPCVHWVRTYREPGFTGSCSRSRLIVHFNWNR